MKWGLLDGGVQGKHNGDVFMEICKIFVIHDTIFFGSDGGVGVIFLAEPSYQFKHWS